jgi:hypothetical protein
LIGKNSVTRSKDWRLRLRGASCAQPIIEIGLCLGELVMPGQKKRVTVEPRLEWSPGKGLYYHALMDRPDHLNELAIKCLLNPGWAETAWSYKETIVEGATDVQGWLRKATAQTIDWENVAL